jgi:hypothetical protein
LKGDKLAMDILIGRFTSYVKMLATTSWAVSIPMLEQNYIDTTLRYTGNNIKIQEHQILDQFLFWIQDSKGI